MLEMIIPLEAFLPTMDLPLVFLYSISQPRLDWKISRPALLFHFSGKISNFSLDQPAPETNSRKRYLPMFHLQADRFSILSSAPRKTG
jgi:hypothetical protein